MMMMMMIMNMQRKATMSIMVKRNLDEVEEGYESIEQLRARLERVNEKKIYYKRKFNEMLQLL